jgi:hypothetical protein
VKIPFFSSKFFGKKQSKNIVLISTETGHLTFSIAERHPDLSEKILYVATYPTLADSALSGTELARKIISSIDLAFDDLLKHRASDLLHHADVVVLLGSPWHISWSDEVLLDKDKPFKVTQALLNDTISKSFETSHSGFTIIGSHVMGYKMNGYAIANPIGKSTKSLTLKAYVESAPREILDPIKLSVQKHVPHSRIYFTTATFAAVETVKAYSNAKDFLLILPEHEVTDIVLVKGGVIETSASVPYGAATLARQLFGKGSSGIEEAFAKSRRLIEGTLGSAEFERTTTLLEQSRECFLVDFRALLWKMNEALLLPGEIYVARASVLSHFITEWLAKEDYTKESFTADGFTIKQIEGKDAAVMLAIDLGEQKKIPFEAISASVMGRQFENRF